MRKLIWILGGVWSLVASPALLVLPAFGEVRVSTDLTLTARTDSASATGYVEVVLADFSVPRGAIVTCADLRLRMPAVAGREIELWVAPTDDRSPWESVVVRHLSRSRRIGFVAEDGSGLVRFDLTSILDGWSVEELGEPRFYLRQRVDGDIETLAPGRVVSGELVIHTRNSRPR